ncbi:MAG: hypothetical protein R3E97_23365 [Candidatus Eisenbacteria bacterium]
MGIVAIGLAHAYLLRWASDDAFITFRYIDQWLAGNGLVFNPGEHVEGYTHPLWLFLLTPFRAAGLPLVSASMFLGLLSFAGLLILLARRCPVTALALALHSEMATWATGGLETMLFTFETLGLVWMVARGRAFLAGLLSVAVVLTRPDGALFAVCAGVFVTLWSNGPGRVSGSVSECVNGGGSGSRSGSGSGSARGRGRNAIGAALRFLTPIVLLLGPYLAWKVWYYGDLFPNPYYAKSGGSAWWSQGGYYLWTVVRGHPTTLLGVLPLLAATLAILRVPLPARLGERLRDTGSEEARRILVAVAFSCVYLSLFVARVGGDFMYARFVVPVLPLLLLSFEGTVRLAVRDHAWPRQSVWLLWLLPVFVLAENRTSRASLFLDAASSDRHRRLQGIEDERWYWTRDIGGGESRLQQARRYGAYFAEVFEGTDVTVSILGQAALGYYGRFPRVVEENGLTEPRIARRPLRTHGRPGHEKRASLDDLRALGVDFRLLLAEPEDQPYRIVHFRISDYAVTGELVRYDAALVSKLRTERADRVHVVDFPEYFDRWAMNEAGRLTRVQLNDVGAAFEAFYFRYNDDPRRWERLRNLMGT